MQRCDGVHNLTDDLFYGVQDNIRYLAGNSPAKTLFAVAGAANIPMEIRMIWKYPEYVHRSAGYSKSPVEWKVAWVSAPRLLPIR